VQDIHPGSIPTTHEQREQLVERLRAWIREHHLRPPLTLDELRAQARAALVHCGWPVQWEKYATVFLYNALWENTVAAVPFDRRILLLPQCLRAVESCRATVDSIGVLCAHCGACPIDAIQTQAEQLGYLVLVAEGATVVRRLVESGQADAVIGVSCLPVLERVFAHLASGAIPALALPLLSDGCRNTAVDLHQLERLIHLRTQPVGEPSSFHQWKTVVRQWFCQPELDRLLGATPSTTDQLARNWLLRVGKRWRAFLLAATWRTLQPQTDEWPDMVRALAFAVECFHKASLIHDDIEDGDTFRYGQPTLHVEHGIPVAINVGDALVGMGYRLIARCGAPPDRIAHMLAAAAEGHQTLCDGQGDELIWIRQAHPLPPERVVAIFERKTAPAFEVALRLGALAAGHELPAVTTALQRFSAALGIAYQILDDMDDLEAAQGHLGPRLSIVYSLTWAAVSDRIRAQVERDWCTPDAESHHRLRNCARRVGALDKARLWVEHYRLEAIRAAEAVPRAELAQFLRRIVSLIIPGSAP
jgi:geranylgeranyl pyrophosphate synthase